MRMLKLELAAESDMRKKLDGFNMFSNGEAGDMQEVDREKRDLQSLKSKLKYDLRKSLAWDSAFSTNSGILELEELFSTSNSLHTEKGCDMLRPKQDQHLYFNNLKPEIKTVTDGFNLRKSLAWDSAFFTSEGILNHEELSLLNKGLKKSEMGMLPQIEELGISSESNCTIDSDGSSSASLEISVHQTREASNTVASCCRNIQKATTRMDGDCVPKLKITFTSRNTDTFFFLLKFSSACGRSDLSSHPKPPKIQSRVRRNAPIAPTKRIPMFSNEVNEGSKTVKASGKVSKRNTNIISFLLSLILWNLKQRTIAGKCLTEKPNLLNTCSRHNDSDSCITLSGEFSSLSSQSHMNASSNGLCSPYKRLSTLQSSPEFSIVKNHTLQENVHQTYSSVGKNFCCISPSISIDGFSPASSVTESIGSHDGNGIMCSNTFSEVKGSNYVSFDASRTVKPSGLRMPSPNIGFFDMDNLLVSIENRDNKSHSRAVSKIKSGQMLEDVRNTRTCSWKTRNINNSRIMKFGHGAVSTAGEGKDCFTKDEKMRFLQKFLAFLPFYSINLDTLCRCTPTSSHSSSSQSYFVSGDNRLVRREVNPIGASSSSESLFFDSDFPEFESHPTTMFGTSATNVVGPSNKNQ
ncbi:hypothetical protein VNO80_13432 [Phaseolus coccineus]|uniref:Uncharacterized protein n=1 Tax=Phaseolus coccineus TaxID=3886 RepID=A0AAN9N2Z7_PHACN